MASSDNVTNEKPFDFEDGDCDPDLEVRLYAEIYYSNETFLPDYESSITNDNPTLNAVQNAEATLSSNKSFVSNHSLSDGGPAPANTKNQLSTGNFEEDSTPGNGIDDRQNSHIGPLYYPKSDWVLGAVSESTGDCEVIEQRPIGTRPAPRKQRQLAQKGLWLAPENTERGYTIARPNVTPSHVETPAVDCRADDPTHVDRIHSDRENDLTRKDSCTPKNGKKRKAKNQKKNVSKRACSKKTLNVYDTTNPPGVTIETDKYEVVSKKKKMKKKKRNVAPQVISSDSDDSIIEVPVPPKPPPLIVELPDSDDDCDPSVDERSKKTKKSPVKKNNGSVSQQDHRTDSSTPDAAAEPLVVESDASKTYELSNEATSTVRDVADVSVEPECLNDSTLILNCTEIQRGASSLDEIRQMRETVRSINTHSDDSMTESEATNWVNIAAGQSDATSRDIRLAGVSNKTANIAAGQVEATGDKEICSVDLSNETVNIELWHERRHNNSASAGIPTENPCALGDGSTVDRTVANKEKTLRIPTISKEKTSTVSTMSKEKTSTVSTTSKEKTSTVSTTSKEKTLSVHATSKEKTSSVSTTNKEKTSSVSATSKEKTSSVSTTNKDKTSSVSTTNKEKTVRPSTTNKEKTSSVSTTNKQVTGTRKRQKEAASRPFTDFNVPAIPRKRSKRLQEKAMSEYFFKPMSNELQAFYNNPWGGENMNVNEIQSKMPANPRCWGILDADLQGPTSKRRRACQRCNTDSHVGSRCPEKAREICCYMCGAKGHTESRCPHTMCLTCGRKYATYRPTCDYCCKLSCNICNGSGHSNENCPDLWRRYHNTTTETMPVVPVDPTNIMKAPQYLWCCNCGRRGHDVTTCQQLRWSQHFPTPMSVSSYTEGPFYESSSREQMQYESSNQMQYGSWNSEQMQYDSSNQQMQYDSSNQQMQYDSSNQQMQYGSSNREQMQCGPWNDEQMQYQLANRESMQYDSSNCQQMPYESSSGEQMQNALPKENWIHNVPRDERIGHPNPNADSIFVPQHQEQIQDASCSNDIEILEVYDGPGTSITAPTISVPSSNVIFRSEDAFSQPTPFMISASRRLNKVKNIHLDGLLNGHLKPMFLVAWNKSFPFSLRITREPNNSVRMIVEANSSIVSDKLQKLVMQWLTRTDDEKQYLEYDIFPYDNTDEIIANIKPKTLLLRTVLEPAILWKKIVACEESLKHIRAKQSRCLNQRKGRNRYQKNVNGIIFNTMKRRSQLVTSLYVGNASRSWVDGGATLVQSFKNIARQVVAKNNILLHQYLELVYLNNELFTAHTSEALSKALDKAILESERSGSTTAPTAKKPSVDASGGKLTESSAEPTAKKSSVDTSGGKLRESSAEPTAKKPSVDTSGGKLTESSAKPTAKKPSVDTSGGKLAESSAKSTVKKPSVDTPGGKLAESSTEPIAKKPSVDTLAGKLPESSTEPIAKKPSVETSAGKLPESSAESVAKNPSVDTSAGKQPESSTEPTANVGVAEKKKSTIQLPKQPMINNNSLAADCSPLTPRRDQQITVVDDTDSHTDVPIPEIFGAIDAWKQISSNTNDETGIDSHTVRNPLFRPASVKGLDSQNAVQTPPTFQRKIVKSGAPQKVGDTKGLLRLLTKRNRKRYKMLAKNAIKIANLTKVPHLQAMAKALKLKSGNGSITTDDVDMLQAAIGPKLSQITQNSPSLRPGESEKFLTSL